MSAAPTSFADEVILAAHKLAAQGVGLKAAEAMIAGAQNRTVSGDTFGEWSQKIGQHVAATYAGGDLPTDIVKGLLNLAIETMTHRLNAARMRVDLSGVPEGRASH